MRRALLIATIAALVLPAQAFAHATLERTAPRFEQRLNAAPRVVTLSFDQYVENLPHAIRLYSTRGELPVPRIQNKGRKLIATVPRLRAGAYTVRWHALSGDGHAPEQYRVATVRNLDAWYAAFSVTPRQKMYLDPKDRVRIW